jgi:TetR/AcrR family transcriptional regulator, mexJK operon transcriptional repressor
MDSEHSGHHKVRIATTPSAIRARRGPGRQTPSGTELRNLELLDKALDLFLEKGFERTTIDGIAASVGMAKRTVYLRYGGKLGLFKASLQRAIEEWIVPVDRLRAAETDNLEETLLRIGRILVANMMGTAGLKLLRITNAESGRMPEIGVFTNTQGTAPTIAYLTDLIRRRVRPYGAAVAEAEEAAMAFLFLVVGGPASLTAWGMAMDDVMVDKHTQYCVHLFLHGILYPQTQAGRSTQLTSKERNARKPSERSDVTHADVQHTQVLSDENRRLKMLLAESMLQVAVLKDQLGSR